MKVTYLKNLILLMIFVFSSLLLAQQKLKTEANADIVEYTNREGLPTTNITNGIQTTDGFIWISSVEGTYRFNGYEFEEVRADIGLPTMQNMYYDSTKNVLYFASPTKFIIFDGKEFKVYTENEGYKINGLSGQLITFVRADSKGRIWIGSATPFVDKNNNGGLTKFENEKFTVYDSKNFPLDNATNFIETPYGDLIFNSAGRNTQTREGSYVALFKNGEFKRIDESAGITLQNANMFPEENVTAIDRDGNTWMACEGVIGFSEESKNYSGVLMYDGNKFHQFTEFKNQLKRDQFPIQVFYSSKMNKLFMTTVTIGGELFNGNNKSIFEFENGKWKVSNILKEINEIRDLKTDRVLNDFKYQSVLLRKSSKYFPERLVFQVTSQNQSSKYPSQLFSYTENKWKKFDSFETGPTTTLSEGVAIKTSKGIGIYYPNYSSMLTSKDGLLVTQSGIVTPYTDYSGLVWFSYSYTDLPAYALTADVGINVWDGKKLRTITEKDGLASNITFKTFQDSKKRVWITTSKGLTVIREIRNSEGEQIFKINSIPDENNQPYNTSNVLETKNGDIYVWQNYVRPASDNLIKADPYFGRLEGEKVIKFKSPFDETDNAKKYQLFDIKEDNEGRQWFFGLFSDNIKDITSVQSKIMLFDGKSWSKPPASWNVPSEQLHYVGNLKNGMYFLTVGGFYVFDGNNFVNLSDSVNENADFRILKGASVAGTKTDNQTGENLYIRLRGRGLVIFDGTNLKFYTKKDGLLSTNLSNPIVDQIRDEVYFSSPSGALKISGNKFQTFFHDESVASGGPYISAMDGFGNMIEFYNGVGLYINKSEEKSYPLLISSVSVTGKFYFYNLPKELPYSENSFIFNYAALNFKDPKQTTYEHFLEGFDKAWSKASTLPFAEYQNLPFGKYTFKVRGITSNGVKTNEASYSFKVNPPIWRTWWAYSFYLIFIGLGLVGIRKFELERRKENENKKFLQIENDRKTKELDEARQLQLSMLPKALPSVPHLDIAVFMKTATEVGGDYYDFHVHLDGTLTVILGDATGHGMMSGMMVSIMKSLFMSDRTNKELKPFFENANEAIKDMQLGRLMMALTCVQISNNKIITTNAGMPPLFIYRNNSQTIEEVVINNLPLGAMKGIMYDIKEIKIERGDTLLLMSDGFAELKNQNQEMYGYKRARNSFEESAKREPEEIITFLRAEARSWTNDKEPDDDVTFVVIKIK
jgi:serine phosphatase RsbU (regulator of sigma subunit)/ligand-binding sensor domain-containing protein